MPKEKVSKEDLIEAVIRALFKEYGGGKKNNNEYKSKYCPFCGGGTNKHDWTFSINAITGGANCLRTSCNFKGGVEEVAKHIGIKTEKEYKAPNINIKYLYNIEEDDATAEYLKGRGISFETIKKTKLKRGFFNNEDWIVFPYFNSEKKEPGYFRARNISANCPKSERFTMSHGVSKKQMVPFWLWDINKRLTEDCEQIEKVYIVEGEIDALTLIECGINDVVSVPTGANSVDVFWQFRGIFDLIPQIIILTDNDESGITARNKIAELFGMDKCRYVELPSENNIKDINDFFKNSIFNKNVLLEFLEKNIKSFFDFIPFWDFNSKGNVEINRAQLGAYMTKLGYRQYAHKEIKDSQQRIFIDKNGWVKVIAKTHIRPLIEHLKENAEKLSLNKLKLSKIMDALANDRLYGNTLNEYIDELSPDEISKNSRGTSNTDLVFFQDVYVKIYTETTGKEKVPVIELNHYPVMDKEYNVKPIWENRIIPRNFKLYPEEKIKQFDFYQFLNNTVDKDVCRLEHLLECIGYAIRSYKDAALAKMVVLLDSGADNETSNGRTGKSIIMDAIVLHFSRAVNIPGRRIDLKDKHVWQRVERGMLAVGIDDVSARFDVEALFSDITSGIVTKKLYRPEEKADYHESPTIVISTNFIIGNSDGSTQARLISCELGHYYNKKHVPKDDFGKRFFDDWNKEDWDKFYSLMIYALGKYLAEGFKYKKENELSSGIRGFLNTMDKGIRYSITEIEILDSLFSDKDAHGIMYRAGTRKSFVDKYTTNEGWLFIIIPYLVDEIVNARKYRGENIKGIDADYVKTLLKRYLELKGIKYNTSGAGYASRHIVVRSGDFDVLRQIYFRYDNPRLKSDTYAIKTKTVQVEGILVRPEDILNNERTIMPAFNDAGEE